MTVVPPWQTQKPKQPALALLDADLRRRLLARADGLDEVTGERLTQPPDIHHRRKKSQGRDDSPSNLLVVSRRTHHRLGQHEKWAREHGFVLSFGEDSTTTALLLHCKRYVLLTDDCRYVDAERGDAA